jgi:IS5 family transposase
LLDWSTGIRGKGSETLQNEMKPGNQNDENQGQFLMNTLSEMLDRRQALYQLAHAIDWGKFEQEFGKLHSTEGRPGLPIRRMVGLLLLKQLCNLSDERLVAEYAQNAYHQYFCGEEQFGWGAPCEASELVHFRHRIGPAGAELILAESIRLHGLRAKEAEVVMDTTAQEKAITFPTDSKLHAKIARKAVKLARKAGVKLRQSYSKTVPKLLQAQRGWRQAKGRKTAAKAARKLKTIAGRLVREVERKLPGKHERELALCKRVLAQKKNDRNKIYSLHEPQVYCLAKGKAHKPYEFGAKASLVRGKMNNVIVGALSFEENPCDGHTPEAALAQVERVAGHRPAAGITDRGYRGKSQCGATQLVMPAKPKADATDHEKRKARKRFRRRAGIEPVIGHLKSDFRLARNYLKGSVGDAVNVLPAATAWNLSLWMRRLLAGLFAFIAAFLFPGPNLTRSMIQGSAPAF